MKNSAFAGTVCGLFLFSITSVSHAQLVNIGGGATSVALDADTLSAAAGLTISNTGGATFAPGSLPGSVGFPINARDASPPQSPTSFSFDASDFLGTFSGSIEHSGSVLFNGDSIEVGDFSIGFDGGRVSGDRSGFFVESTAGLTQILFDIANPLPLATNSGVTIEADLIVSGEFAADLLALNLASTDLTGADVGDALVEAVVPEPASLVLVMLVAVAGAVIRRRM